MRVMKLSGSPVEVRARGCTIWDQNGKAYLDFAGGYGTFTVGHSHPRVIAAVKEQLEAMSLSGKTMFTHTVRMPIPIAFLMSVILKLTQSLRSLCIS